MKLWLNPNRCLPPHRITHPEKLVEIKENMLANGWRLGAPILLGYWDEEERKVQLVSGSHRWAAAKELDVRIPIEVISRKKAYELWGTEQWCAWLSKPPVLEHYGAIL